MVRVSSALLRYVAIGLCIAAAMVLLAFADKATEGTVCMGDQRPAPSDRPWEYVVKATYLHHLEHYVRWPSGADAASKQHFVVGVVGDSPIVDALGDLSAAKTTKHRPLVVKQFRSVSDYTHCHVLFVAASLRKEEKQQAIHQFQNRAVLLVGEEPGFVDRGGVMNLASDGKRVHVEVNLKASRQAGLEISSRLLALAKVVDR
jgi:hypothetical protein